MLIECRWCSWARLACVHLCSMPGHCTAGSFFLFDASNTTIYIEPNYRWAKLRAIKLMFRWSKMKIAQQVPERGQSYSIITGWRITNKRWSVCSLGGYPFAWSLIARQSLVKCPQCPFVTDNWPLILRYLSNWGQLGQVVLPKRPDWVLVLIVLIGQNCALSWSRSVPSYGADRLVAIELTRPIWKKTFVWEERAQPTWVNVLGR